MPGGTVTFLLTDIEGSTRMWEAHPAAMQHALKRHNACVRAAVEGHGGTVVTSRGEGDSFFAVFASAVDAVNAAAACQRQHRTANGPAMGFFSKIFTWWDGATVGTALFSAL